MRVKKPKTFVVEVVATKYETYNIDADSSDEAEKQAKEEFRDEHGSYDKFDDIEASCSDDDE